MSPAIKTRTTLLRQIIAWFERAARRWSLSMDIGGIEHLKADLKKEVDELEDELQHYPTVSTAASEVRAAIRKLKRDIQEQDARLESLKKKRAAV